MSWALAYCTGEVGVCIIATKHACTMIRLHTHDMNFVMACTLAIIHVCFMTIIHTCITKIIYVYIITR